MNGFIKFLKLFAFCLVKSDKLIVYVFFEVNNNYRFIINVTALDLILDND